MTRENAVFTVQSILEWCHSDENCWIVLLNDGAQGKRARDITEQDLQMVPVKVGNNPLNRDNANLYADEVDTLNRGVMEQATDIFLSACNDGAEPIGAIRSSGSSGSSLQRLAQHELGEDAQTRLDAILTKAATLLSRRSENDD